MRIYISNTMVKFFPSEKLAMDISSSTYWGNPIMILIKDYYEQEQ